MRDRWSHFWTGMMGVAVGAVMMLMVPAVAQVVDGRANQGDALALGEPNDNDQQTRLGGTVKSSNLRIVNRG